MPTQANISPQNHRARLRMLLVEDNEDVRNLTVCLLESSDREVSSCASAEQALQLCQQQAFDLVITDISLPGMSGIDLAKFLVRQSPSTWVVIASGYEIPGGVDTLGPHVCAVAKPFESDQIDNIVARMQMTS